MRQLMVELRLHRIRKRAEQNGSECAGVIGSGWNGRSVGIVLVMAASGDLETAPSRVPSPTLGLTLTAGVDELSGRQDANEAPDAATSRFR